MARDLLLEIGTEELPASFVAPALEELARVITERMDAARLGRGEVRTYGTSRRLAVQVSAVADTAEDVTREVTGPPVKAAFDKDGKPTRAAEKFAESLGRRIEELERVTTPKGEYLGARIEEKGRSAFELLQDVLHAAAHGISFPKSMRWGDVEVAFARPVQWLVALLGEEVVPVVFGDVRSGRTTRGHRFLAPAAIALRQASDYVPALTRAHVVSDVAERRALVLERVRAAAERAGGRLLEDNALLDEVTNLVELPNPMVGRFDERHLDLPPEVLIQEMKSHQRYFSVVDAEGRLLPCFVVVANTPVREEALAIRGFERVLKARLSDGRFFFDEDRKVPLAARVEKLERVVWQGKLGTYAEKVERLTKLALLLAERTGNADKKAAIERAARLAKADLVTGMVGEFPELQGVMGREYAKASGERPEVALAVFEHYLPRGASDALPTRDEGALIGLADRLDSLVGIFSLGKRPSGAADPFGLRRAALGFIHVVFARGYRFSLSEAVDQALALVQPKVADVKRKAGEPPVRTEVLGFFRARLEALWREEARADVVEAVLCAGFDDLVAARKRLEALQGMVGQADFAPLASAFKRVANIVEKQGKDVAAGPVDRARLEDPAEKALYEAFGQARGRVDERIHAGDYSGALRAITGLKLAVDTFFEQVLVMVEDKALRENRIRLLAEIGRLFGRVADFTRLQAE